MMQLRAEEPSPVLGPLVEEWLTWMRSPSGISPRTQRPYSAQTIRRYEVSWHRLFDQLAGGRGSALAELTSGALAQYWDERTGDQCRGQTVNRDLCALQLLMRWAREEKGLLFESPHLRKVKESSGRERWLSPAEIEAVRPAAPIEWWPLFALLIYTGLRVGEAQGLRWGDVRFSDGILAVHSGYRQLKSETSDRDVPIPQPLAAVLTAHSLRVPSEPADMVFGGGFGDYWRARRVWRSIIGQAGISYCRIHDLRHTYGVHAARAGVPLARLQRLPGHEIIHVPRALSSGPLVYHLHNPLSQNTLHIPGVVAERLKAAVLKTAKGATPS
jgi:integrase